MYDTIEQLADALADQCARPPVAPSSRPVDDLVGDLAATQRAINSLTALRDRQIAQLAAIEDVPSDDGSITEIAHPLGSARLDAAALISESLGISDHVAGRTLQRALWLATTGRPVAEALGQGRIDDYRATVLHEELVDATPEAIADALARLDGTLHEHTAGPLRRRIRRILTNIEPDSLRRRAARAKTERSLRRWLGEPGMDCWLATLPAEQAGPAFQAIDLRARQRLSDGLNDSIDNARADALLDMILGHTTTTVGVNFHVPTTVLLQAAVDETEAATMDPAELMSVDGLSPTGPVLLRRADLQDLIDHCLEVLTGRPSTELTTADKGSAPAEEPTRQPISATMIGCDPTTGATATIPLDPSATDRRTSRPALASDAHDAPAALTALVRARDGHCRFPGCTTNARSCDLDHVIPWPQGPTRADNLVCLCRRHHRIKQLDSWSVRLQPDGTAVWIDRCGRERVTHPVDHLHLDQSTPDRARDTSLSRAPKPLLRMPINAARAPATHAFPGPLGIPAVEPKQTDKALADWLRYDQFSLLEQRYAHVVAQAEAITKAAASRRQRRTLDQEQLERPPF